MKKTLLKISLWLKSIFSNSLNYLERRAGGAVELVNVIKSVLDSPITTAIAVLTPTKVDDELLYQAKRYVNSVANSMAIFKGILDATSSDEETIKAIVDHLKTLSLDQKTAFYVEFSGRLAQYLSDGKITLAEGIMLTQMIYNTSR